MSSTVDIYDGRYLNWLNVNKFICFYECNRLFIFLGRKKDNNYIIYNNVHLVLLGHYSNWYRAGCNKDYKLLCRAWISMAYVHHYFHRFVLLFVNQSIYSSFYIIYIIYNCILLAGYYSAFAILLLVPIDIASVVINRRSTTNGHDSNYSDNIKVLGTK